MNDKIETLRVEIAKLTLSPGDVLVVKVDAYINQEQSINLREQMLSHLPQGIKVIVLAKEISLAILTRAEIEQRAVGQSASTGFVKPHIRPVVRWPWADHRVAPHAAPAYLEASAVQAPAARANLDPLMHAQSVSCYLFWKYAVRGDGIFA